MKKKIGLLSLLLLTLSACNIQIQIGSTSKPSEELSTSIEESINHPSIEESMGDQPSIEESKEEDSLPSVSISTSEILPSVDTSTQVGETKKIDIYCINDFHGATDYRLNKINTRIYQLGISRMAQFLKDRKALNPEGTFIVSSGDMWQGGYVSSASHGDFLTRAMNLLQFDCMAIGNHEFDWGEEAIVTNQTTAEFPLLGSNIYYANGAKPSWVEDHTIISRNGIKVGFIGSIGETQESSILASISQNFDFKDEDQAIQSQASIVKNEGADLVISLSHCDWRSYSSDEGQSAILNNKVVDGVFSGHSHSLQNTAVNNIPVLQAYSSGTSVAHMSFEMKMQNGRYVKNKTTYEVVNYIADSYANKVDPEMEQFYQNYIKENGYESGMKDVLTTIRTDWSQEDIGKISAEAMRTYFSTHSLNGRYYDAVLGVQNTAGVRAFIEKGEVTYADIYEAFPFDNVLVLIEANASKMTAYYSSATNPSYYYYSASQDTFSGSGTFYMATMDYVEGTRYFPHNAENVIWSNILQRDAIKEYLLNIYN